MPTIVYTLFFKVARQNDRKLSTDISKQFYLLLLFIQSVLCYFIRGRTIDNEQIRYQKNFAPNQDRLT